MFSLLRTRFGIPGVISVLALVLAMAGGAYAAKKYVITSTSQIKPSVLKSLQGAAGSAGAPGVKGDNGSQGATGGQGSKGDLGAEGKEGKQGKEGKAGSPWTVGGVLPSEATETGAWTIGSLPSGTPEFELTTTAISIPIPLNSALGATSVHYINKAGKEVFLNPSEVREELTPTECLGTAAAPTAEPGNLCVYEGQNFFLDFYSITLLTSDAKGSSTAGARLGMEAEAEARASGSWAVTAP
jgi:hypothetical protein